MSNSTDTPRDPNALTDAEIATHTYMAVEGPMFTVGDVQRILVDRAASTVHTDDGLRAAIEGVLAIWDRQVGQFSDVTARLAIAGCADDLRAALDASPAPTEDRAHNHPPYRPVCNERQIDGQLRGACLNDDGSNR